MSLATKRRSLGQLTTIPQISTENMKTGEKSVPGPPLVLKDRSMQVTASEPHNKDRFGRYLSGGPFYTGLTRFVSKDRINFKGVKGDGINMYVYSGPVFPFSPSLMDSYFSEQSLRSKDTSDLDPLGATAISRCSPVNPVDTLGQGIVEAHRDGLPSIPGFQFWERRARIALNAGSEFLNVVFGWDPLVSEVKDFSSTVRNSRDILKQYHRDQGKNIARTYRFPISESSSTDVIKTKTHALLGTGLSGSGEDLEKDPFHPWHTTNEATVYRTITTTVSQWFKGSFTYAVPSQSDSWRRMLGYGSDADKLFGIALTPELLWNVAPWSWAVDWFSNAGDVIRNVSNFAGAGQVMRYGYMMEEHSTIITYSMDRSCFFVGSYEIPAPTTSFQLVTKVRRPANPYGFGISSGSLSPLQIAIVAALGITLL